MKNPMATRSAQRINTALGVGIGYRDWFKNDILKYKQEIDFCEVNIGALPSMTSKRLEEYDWLISNFSTIIPHCTQLSIGSADGYNKPVADAFKLLSEKYKIPWVSDHLSFTKVGKIELGHMACLPFTEEAVQVVKNNYLDFKSKYNIPLLLENVAYTYSFPASEYTEAEFIKRVVEETGCGLLLDIANLYANCLNYKYNPFAFLDVIPMESIVQVHITGGYLNEKDFYIDSHSEKIHYDVWYLLDYILERVPVKAVVIERDDEGASLLEVTKEVRRIRKIGRKYNRWH